MPSSSAFQWAVIATRISISSWPTASPSTSPEETLVYAADEGVMAAEHTVVESGKQLRVVALDLTAPRSNIVLQIRTLAASIRPQQSEREVTGARRGAA